MSGVITLRPNGVAFETGRATTAPPESAVRVRTALARVSETLLRPRIGTTLALGIGVLMSLAPGLLPRTPGTQAVLTGLLAALALGIAGLGSFALRQWNRLGRTDIDINRRWRRWRRPLLGGMTVLILGATVQAWHWQNQLRAAMDAPAIGPGYWVHSAVGAAIFVAALAGICEGVRWTIRRLGPARAVAIAVAAASVAYLVGVPTVVDSGRSTYAAANAAIDPTLVQPVSLADSGSSVSEVSWSSLGAEGRKFVSAEPTRPVRVYVGVDSAPDLDSRVALAIRELERTGGFDRANLVLAVPTGSGWIDNKAVQGFDQRFDGNVAVVGLQYSYAPSWVTFVFGRDEAIGTARALFTAIENHLRTREHKPALYVYGQSLGALGGSGIFADNTDQDRRTCAALWAGPPAGQVHSSGATVLSNSSDPVVHWSPALLWRAPDLSGVRVDAPVPPWFPVASFFQASADLLGALKAPPGHGHRYGIDQGTALGNC